MLRAGETDIHTDAENPVECARVYDMLARAFYSRLVCCGLSNGADRYRSSKVKNENRRKGAFGHTPAVYGVTEAQGKGGLHTHGIGFQCPLCMALRRFAGAEGKDKELRAVYDAIDSHISGTVSSSTRESRMKQRNWSDNATPIPPKSNCVDDRKEYDEAKSEDAEATNLEAKYHVKCRRECEAKTRRSHD